MCVLNISGVVYSEILEVEHAIPGTGVIQALAVRVTDSPELTPFPGEFRVPLNKNQ